MPTVDPRLRARLQEIRQQRAQLQQQRNQAKQKRDEAKAALTANGGTPDLTSPEFARAQAASARVASIDAQLEDLKDAELDVLNVLGTVLGGGPLGGTETILDNPQVIEQLARYGNTSTQIGRIDLGTLVSRDEFAAMFGRVLRGDAPLGYGADAFGGQMMAAITDNAPNFRIAQSGRVIPELRPRLRVTDLFPSATMDTKTEEYVAITAPPASGTGAAETAEEATKPELALTLTDASVTAQTIAGWIKVAKQKLADSSELGTRLKDRVSFAVLARIEYQLLNGNGTGINLTGLNSLSGTQTQTFTAGAITPDQILRGVGKGLGVGAQPNAVILSINDWVAANLLKATGSGDYLLGGALQAVAENWWGAAVVPSFAQADGTAWVLDTTRAGRIRVREGLNVLISDNDQDDFSRNRVTILGESRVGFEWEEPSAAVKVALA